MTNPFHDEINRLNKRLDQLTYLIEKQISNGAKGFAKLGLEEKAHDMGKKLRNCCEDWISTSQETLDTIKCSAEEQTQKVRDNVEKYPIISLGISALIGYFIALILSPRRK